MNKLPEEGMNERININITLEEESNKKYYDLWNESKDLMTELNPIVSNLKTFSLPKYFIGRARKNLEQEGERLLVVESTLVKWRDKVIEFCMKPEFHLYRKEPQEITYLHFTFILNNRLDQVDRYFLFTSNLHELVKSELRAVQNNTRFMITTWLALIAIALAISLATM